MSPSTNIVMQPSKVSRDSREQLLGHKGAVVWLTGFSGAGKSTVGFALEQTLMGKGILAFALDGDNVRHGLCGDLGFSPTDRSENIRRVGEVAALLADAGVVVVACFISPYQQDRDRARLAAGDHRFFEVFLDTPMSVCEERDPKGLYIKARAGTVKDFTGVSSPYERPVSPALTLHTDAETVGESVDHIVGLLLDRGVISGG